MHVRRKSDRRQKEKTEGYVEIKGGFTLGNQNETYTRSSSIERVAGRKKGERGSVKLQKNKSKPVNNQRDLLSNS